MSSLAQHLFQEDIYSIPAPVMVVIAHPWHTIQETDKALLAKILGSVRVNIDAVTIVEREQASLDSLAAFSPRKVLVFGSRFADVTKPYENTVINNVSVILADDFGQLDDARKKSLWGALKQMFSV